MEGQSPRPDSLALLKVWLLWLLLWLMLLQGAAVERLALHAFAAVAVVTVVALAVGDVAVAIIVNVRYVLLSKVFKELPL